MRPPRSHPAIALLLLVALATVGLTACTPQAQTTKAATATPTAQTITVTLTDTSVTASQTTVRAGVPCRFIVVNRGTQVHQFWVTPQGMAQMMSHMPMAQWRQQVFYRTQDIGPGMVATFTYTFTMPMVQQRLAFGCYSSRLQTIYTMPFRVNP